MSNSSPPVFEIVSDLAALEARCRALVEEHAALKAELAEADRKHDEAVAAHGRAVAEMSELKAKVRELWNVRSELKRMRKDRDRHKAEAAHLRGALALMHDSLSWRLTAPLRAVARFVRR